MVPIGTFVGLGIWGSFIDEPVTPKAQSLAQVVDTTTDPSVAATTTDAAAAEASAAAKADAEAAAEAKRKAKAKALAAKKAKALAAKKVKILAAKKAAEERAAAKRRAAAKPESPITVTPGAFCADSQAGDIGVSSAGNSYRCSIYPNGRYRWKRI
jgi:uncharacterized membrane protein YqiK